MSGTNRFLTRHFKPFSDLRARPTSGVDSVDEVVLLDGRGFDVVPPKGTPPASGGDRGGWLNPKDQSIF